MKGIYYLMILESPHSIGCIFTLLTVSFAVWEILSLTQSRYLTFALVACALAIRLTQTSIGEFLSYIFFQEFCGIRPYAKGLNPFELFREWCEKGIQFLCSACVSPFPQHSLLKRLLSLSGLLGSLVKYQWIEHVEA